MQIVTQILKNSRKLRKCSVKNLSLMCHVLHVTCNMSHVTCHMSTVTITSSHNHRQSPCKLSHYAQKAGSPRKQIKKSKNTFSNLNKCSNLEKRFFCNAILAKHSSTRSLQSMRFWLPPEGTNNNKRTESA